MGRLKFGSGSVRVEMDDTLDRLYRRALDKVAPGVVARIDEATSAVFDAAVGAWPVRTGRSRAGLEHHLTVASDHTTVRGTITDAVEYSRYIKARKLGGKSAFVELLRLPMRERAKALAAVLATETRANLIGS